MRNPGKWPRKGMTQAELNKERLTTLDFIRNRGTARVPSPPRDLTAQSGPRGVLLTWSSPRIQSDIVGWRIYKNDENTLYHELRDRGVKQMFVESSASTVSPTANFFVSSINELGQESATVQVQGAAVDEPNAPQMPGVPPGFNNGFSGGGGQGNQHGIYR